VHVVLDDHLHAELHVIDAGEDHQQQDETSGFLRLSISSPWLEPCRAMTRITKKEISEHVGNGRQALRQK
jgi:hypothetical protein